MRPLHCAVVLASMAVATPSTAQTSTLAAFAAPLPQGTSQLHVQLGWPGISAAYWHGLAARASLGGRFTFNYGFEGATGPTVIGLKAQAALRLGLMQTDRVELALEISPGLLLYFPSGFTQVGLTVPVALAMGFPLSDAFAVHLAIEAPLSATFTQLSSFFVPLYFGGGVEYALDKGLGLTFALRMGPIIDTRFGAASFGLNALFGAAFKI